VRPTGVRELAPPFAVLAGLTYLVLRVAYGSIPPLPSSIAITLGVLAALEFVVARRVRSAVRHHPDAKAMTALAIARATALGKASALAAAALAGVGVGFLARVAPDAGRVRAAGSDLWVSAALTCAAVLLLAAGIVLERAGIDPGNSPNRGVAEP
jgi:hypothetical protein